MLSFFEKTYNRFFRDNLFLRIRKILYTKNWFKTGGLENPQPSFRTTKGKSNQFAIRPPPFIKQKIVKCYAKRFSIDILIETGTFHGDMVIANRKTFKKIYSIELSEKFYKIAKKNCAKYSNISLYNGDSSKILPKILSNIKNPCLFWLDAHYIGEDTTRSNTDTPIMRELQHIFKSSDLNHVILIDDAQDFIGKNDYPTIEQLKKFIQKNRPDWDFLVKDDIIRIYKKLPKKKP